MMGGSTTRHVEQFPDINKLCNVASCWIYVGILLAHPILHISRLRVNILHKYSCVNIKEHHAWMSAAILLRHLKISNENNSCCTKPATNPPLPTKKIQNQDRVIIFELKPRYGILFTLRRSGFDKKKVYLGFVVGQVSPQIFVVGQVAPQIFLVGQVAPQIFTSADVRFRWQVSFFQCPILILHSPDIL
jgi:hypothetical protein